MVKQRIDVSKSENKFRFLSFRDKISDLKIEPFKDLKKKHFNITDKSHLYETFEYWSDINLSGSYDSFQQDISELIKNLPTIIYNKDTILKTILKYIGLHDELSLQPLCEILSQFVHDLNEDFLPYYMESLNTLIALIKDSIIRQKVKAFEYGFNCLIYIFKYLSKQIIRFDDSKLMIQTFEIFNTLITDNANFYIKKFSAESLSFLVRKCNKQLLKQIVDLLFDKLNTVEYELNNYEGIYLILSEALKISEGNLHSKLEIITSILLDKSLIIDDIEEQKRIDNKHKEFIMSEEYSQTFDKSSFSINASNFYIKKTSLVNDVLLDIIRHVSPENSAEVYSFVIAKINHIIASETKCFDIEAVLKVLATISYAESGYKVSDWGQIIKITKKLMQMFKEQTSKCTKDYISSETWSFLFITLLRNCSEEKVLLKDSFHTAMLEFINANYPHQFLPFVDYWLNSNSQTRDKFSSNDYNNLIKEFILVRIDEDQFSHTITTFLLRNASKHFGSFDAFLSFNFEVETLNKYFEKTLQLKNELLNSTNRVLNFITISDFLINNCSVNDILKQSDNAIGTTLIEIFKELVEQTENYNDQYVDCIGKFLSLLQFEGLILYSTYKEIIQQRLISMKSLYRNLFFIKGLKSFLVNLAKQNDDLIKNEITSQFLNNKSDLLFELCDNLLLPNKQIRVESFFLIQSIALISPTKLSIPECLNTLCLIEDIPHDLTSARDIQMRLRNMVNDYLKVETTVISNRICFNYLFGLITIRFSPIFDTVIDSLSKLYFKDEHLVFDLCFKFLTIVEDQNESLKFNYEFESEFEVSDTDPSLGKWWIVKTSRLEDTIRRFHNVSKGYVAKNNNFIIELIIQNKVGFSSDDKFEYPLMLKQQILKALITFPQLAERFYKKLVPFFLRDEEDGDLIISSDRTELKADIEKVSKYTKRWTDSDKNLLLKLFGSFTNIVSFQNSDLIYERFLLLLTNRSTDVQKLALSGIFAYKNKVVNKYRDNFNNLLNDVLFKDEITKILSTDPDAKILEDADEDAVIPLILRIMFGRVQTPNTNGLKKSRKTAVISYLPYFKEADIIKFLEIGSQRLNYQYFFSNGNVLDKKKTTANLLRRMSGFLNVVNSLFSVLGSKFPDAFASIIEPLMFCCAASYYIIDSKVTDDNIDKTAINIRQQSLKAFYNIFEYYGSNINWSKYLDAFQTIVVEPRLLKFDDENLQQPSSILKIISYWANDIELYEFLYYNEFASAKALMKTLVNDNVKESVIGVILNFVNNLILKPVMSDLYVELIAITVSNSLEKLPKLFTIDLSPETSNIAVELLLNIEATGFIENIETKNLIIHSLTNALDFQNKKISHNNITKVLAILNSLVKNYDNLEFENIKGLYNQLSILLRYSVEKDIRIALAKCFQSIGEKIGFLKSVSDIICDVNSFTLSRQSQYDFDRRLEGFRRIIDEDNFLSYSEIEWIPLLQTCLYFVNDPEEYVMRTNGSKIVNCFTDYLNKNGENLAALDIMKDIILPNLQKGLRKKNDDIKNEYISMLSYIVSKSKTFIGLEDMKVLVNEVDPETDFFNNINHIQLHRRSRAIRKFNDELCHKLCDNSIAHYLIPMIENYVFVEEEKFRALCNDSIQAIGILSNYLAWSQFKALFRRYKSMVKNDFKNLKELVVLLVRMSNSLRLSLLSFRKEDKNIPSFTKFPKTLTDPENFIKTELYPEFTKILNNRDDETIIARIPLSEVLVNCILGLSSSDISSYLPGSLTSVCQVLRSRSEELRDAVRRNLSKICVLLGTDYLQFIIKELKGALTRGSQIHVLSFTVHHVLTTLDSSLQVGDLDSSIKILMDIIMEDIFGSAGQEKDSEGYQSKTKEVKHNKSFDTSEIVSSYISIKQFGIVLKPIKSMLLERLPNKVQNKLKELIRRISLGITKNPESATTNFLKLCHEIYKESADETAFNQRKRKVLTEQEEHFIVNLNAKSTHVETENSLYIRFLQKISIDLLRSAIVKNDNLMKVEYLESFIPILKKLLFADDEMVVISTLRVLIIFSKLEFSKDSEPIFKNCCRKAFNIIKDSPSTSSDICQFSLKFLSAILRNKPDVEIKNSALSFILTKLLPDFNEPTRQGLAFNFLKSLVMKHCMIPELYDIVDSISETMVANHSKEIRDVSRSVYYQFLVEYDHSVKLLEKKFKFLITNLQYPSPDGRISILELVQMIIKKSSPELILKLSSSLFVALANVACNDDDANCKEVAFDLLGKLLKRLTRDNTRTIENYILTWMKQFNNELFINLGLRMYKVFFLSIGYGINAEMDMLATSTIKKNIVNSKKQYDDMEDLEEVDDISWQLLYTSLNLLSSMCEKDGSLTELKKTEYSQLWCECIPSLILYPHPWVRLYASKLNLISIDNADSIGLSNYQIQTIVFKLFRQLSAPNISEELATTSIKLMIKIIMRWNSVDQLYIQPSEVGDKQIMTEIIDEDLSTSTAKFKTWIDFVISKATYMLRNENLTPKESHTGKKSMIQLLALIVQVLSVEKLTENNDIVPKILMPLFIIMEKDGYHLVDEADIQNLEDLQSVTKDCMQILEDKLGINKYTSYYATVNKVIATRRQERKAKRSRLEITNPELASNKKLKKHKNSKENRKFTKDSSGYYKRKRT
ncbi:hypothetical protein QEN19_003568 [Hanseniaspora menglaensis]